MSLGTWRGFRKIRMERHDCGTYPVLECECCDCGKFFEKSYRSLRQTLQYRNKIRCPECYDPVTSFAADPSEPLRSARIISRVSQRRIAERVGVSETCVRKYERCPERTMEPHKSKLDAIYREMMGGNHG